MNKEYKYIDSNEEFEKFYATLKSEKIIAVDLEADSMHHFKEKVCLIQIAGTKSACVLDPLRVNDFSKLKILMEDENIEKVFHGSDFDIRSLDREYKIRVNNLFDSEIACKFLGAKERGLAALLKKYFKVNQDKKFQKKDWSQRPLPDEMISYSIVDVLYLIELAQILKQKLNDKRRLEWAKEEFLRQTQVRYEGNRSEYYFMKFKGAGKMDRKTLAVLESLLAMRVKIAEKRDLPLFKVLGAGEITQIAFTKPLTLNQLQTTRALSKRQQSMYGELCINAVNKALGLDEEKMPLYPKNNALRLNNIEHKRIKLLKKMREKKGEDLMLEQGFLINNALITKLAVKNPLTKEELGSIQQIRKWQIEALSDDILKVLLSC
ncbi:MAG: HRDC domain-containing protein [Desulfobacteraceae bacterium]|nr:HRDC domain-containing protein [Desulfobacteraceae bacterium]